MSYKKNRVIYSVNFSNGAEEAWEVLCPVLDNDMAHGRVSRGYGLEITFDPKNIKMFYLDDFIIKALNKYQNLVSISLNINGLEHAKEKIYKHMNKTWDNAFFSWTVS